MKVEVSLEIKYMNSKKSLNELVYGTNSYFPKIGVGSQEVFRSEGSGKIIM